MTGLLAAMFAALLTLTAPTRAAMVEDCNQEYDWDLKIGGCTAAIRSGHWQGKNLTATYTNRGEAYRNLGDPTRAIENYGQALRLDPGNALVYNSRGNAYDDLGDHARAIEDYDQALRFDPDFTIAYYNRGAAYRNLGDPARAIQDYDQALRLDPGYVLAYNNRGFAYRNLGDHARAIEDYDQALRFDPDFTIAYYNRAGAHCALGQVEASFDDRVEALRLGALTAEALQSYLRHHRFYKGAIDGDFGPASRKALRDWTAAGCH